MLKVNFGVNSGQSVLAHAEGRYRGVGVSVDVVGPDVIDVMSEGASPFGNYVARHASFAFCLRSAVAAVVLLA